MTIKNIQARFTSGNDIPIDKAMVPASEWNAAMAEIQVLKDQFIWDKLAFEKLEKLCDERGSNEARMFIRCRELADQVCQLQEQNTVLDKKLAELELVCQEKHRAALRFFEKEAELEAKLAELNDQLALQTLHADTLEGALTHLTKRLKEEKKLDQYYDLRDVFDLGKQDGMTDEAWRQLTQVIPFRLREVMKGHLYSIEVLHESLNKIADECLEGYGWSLSPWASTGQYGVAVEAK